jgi:hypothetical protein
MARTRRGRAMIVGAHKIASWSDPLLLIKDQVAKFDSQWELSRVLASHNADYLVRP